MVRASLTNSPSGSWAPFLFLPHFDAICDLMIRLTSHCEKKKACNKAAFNYFIIDVNDVKTSFQNSNLRTYYTSSICGLHWLPIRQRNTYKILLLTYKALNDMALKYIVDLLQYYIPIRVLRSYIFKTSTGNTKIKSQVLWRQIVSSCAARLWNALPDRIRSIPSTYHSMHSRRR